MPEYFVTALLPLSFNDDHLDKVDEYLKNELGGDLKIENNPNITIINQTGETLKIKQVRELIENLSYSTYQGKKRWMILLHVDKATAPAQNALLKILEEPPANTQILLTCSAITALLPTITSRCKLVSLSGQFSSVPQLTQADEQAAEAALKKLQTGSYSEAIELAAEYKDREAALGLVNNMLLHVTSLLSTESSNRALIETGKKLLDARLALQQNLNPALALEELFFNVIKHYQANSN